MASVTVSKDFHRPEELWFRPLLGWASTFRKGFGFGLHPDGLSPPKEQLASAAAVRDSRTDFGPDEYRRRFVGRTFVPTTCGSGGRARVSPVGFGRSGREIATRVSAPKAARRGGRRRPSAEVVTPRRRVTRRELRPLDHPFAPQLLKNLICEFARPPRRSTQPHHTRPTSHTAGIQIGRAHV